jgi:hypothetical protein
MSSDAAGDRTPNPVKLVAVIVGAVLGLALLAAGITALFWAAGHVSGPVRFLLAVPVALVIAAFGMGYFRQLGNPPPPEPEPVSVDPGLRLAYLCEMCGMELAVVVAAKEKAPKHCGESMVLVRRRE